MGLLARAGNGGARAPTFKAAKDSWRKHLVVLCHRGSQAPALRDDDGGATAAAATAARQKVRDHIATFCETYSDLRVEPTEEELEAVWRRCCSAKSAHVAAALHEQLLGAASSHLWQPRLRAARLLSFLYARGAAGRAAAQAAATRSIDVLQHLAADVPPCQEAASRALLLQELAGVLVPGQEVQMADHGGILFFTAGGDAPAEAAVAPPFVAAPAAVVRARSAQEGREETSHAPVVDLLGLSSSACRSSSIDGGKVADSNDLISLNEPQTASTVQLLDLVVVSEPSSEGGLREATKPASTQQVALEVAIVHQQQGFHHPGQRKVQVFDLASDDQSDGNPELDEIFSFTRHAAHLPRVAMRRVPDIPLVTSANAHYLIPTRRDPFAFVGDYIAAASN